jgi:glutathione synthase/RimK-type ligase-like ATP-grasp enzyme
LEALGNYSKPERAKIILNFGCDYNRDDILVLNKKISHIRDKIMMNKLLDKYNIPHPKTYYFPFDNLPNTEDKCVIKDRFGSMGNHLIFTTFNKIHKDIPDNYLSGMVSGTTYSVNSETYVQDYIPFEKEFRVGVDFKRVLGIREKIGSNKIRNSKTCEYKTVHSYTLSDFAWDVTKKFELDFVGIDIGMWLGTYMIIELNSAPTIGPTWANKLKNDLLRLYHELSI